MCGIAGFLSTGGSHPGRELLCRMESAIRHRGPDATGSFLSGDGKIGFTHRRLSILDLSEGGAQPMVSSEGYSAITYNGEVFNYLEIRKNLIGKGYTFKGESDTEVILASCQEWGVDEAVKKFIGMFAFAYWDGKTRKLFLVRDRLGIKPLYIARADRIILFASELKAVMACPSYPRDIDPAGLQYYLEFQYIPDPYTIFRNAKKVLPGHIVEIGEDGSERVRPYWNLSDHLGRKEDTGRREEEYTEQLFELLSSSVRYRMISDVPIGAFLSGGVDSSLVVALMQRVASRPVQTFSIGFSEKEYDESVYAKEVARHLGTDHHEKICTGAEALGLVRRLPDYYDEPFADSSAIPSMLLSEFTRRHVTVSLSGDGGDELFGGYSRYNWNWQRVFVGNVPLALRRIIGNIMSLFPIRKINEAKNTLLSEDEAAYYFRLIAMFQKEQLNYLINDMADDSQLLFYKTFRFLNGFGFVEKAMATDIRTYMVDDILTKVDRASMAYSLEARVPLLDHRIVEFAARLPLQFKRKRFESKIILRNILYKYVPRELIERPKKGFAIPLALWLRNELKPLLEEYLNEERLRKEGIFKTAAVSRLISEHLSLKKDHRYRLWGLLVFALWREKYQY